MSDVVPHNCGDPNNWRHHKPVDGKIKTTCRACKRFIGYRDADPEPTDSILPEEEKKSRKKARVA